MAGILEEAWQILHPLRVVSKLLLHSDPESSLHIGCELGLPHLLFDLTGVMVDKLSVIKVNAERRSRSEEGYHHSGILNEIHASMSVNDSPLSVFVKEPWIDDVLSQVLAVLLVYWDRHDEWTEVENRL